MRFVFVACWIDSLGGLDSINYQSVDSLISNTQLSFLLLHDDTVS